MSTLRVNNLSNLNGAAGPYTPGSVIQVVHSTTYTQTSTSSTTPVATALNITITPRSTSSKILITFSGQIYHNTYGKYGRGHIYRGATKLSNDNGFVTHYGGNSDNVATPSVTIMDTPNTISAVTYTFYIASPNAGGTVYAPIDANFMSFTAMEVAA